MKERRKEEGRNESSEKSSIKKSINTMGRGCREREKERKRVNEGKEGRKINSELYGKMKKEALEIQQVRRKERMNE